MSDIAIKVEQVGKLYRLGEVGTGTLSQDLKRWWAITRGKDDPFAIVGETNDRTQKGESDFVWALKDVSFEVKQGEVLGIIGRNGAGKSTLLKLLSKVTTPTTGSIKVNGRIASLLEVGTGFHPDLTGRENVFLNGAILGMTKAEVKKKFDEIVDFAGVERYIDTPVKRYSSGMYVRLAFAVAAFLEPEILIIDEVLAVGDAEFQKKCLGRMKDISVNDGRTVLFVSHNMAAIQSLCTTGLYMSNGTVKICGNLEKVLNNYLIQIADHSKRNIKDAVNRKGNGIVKIASVTGLNKDGIEMERFLAGESLTLKVSFEARADVENKISKVDIGINTQINERVTWLSTSLFFDKVDFSKELAFEIGRLSLTPGYYNLNIYCEVNGVATDWIENIYQFEVEESDYYSTGRIIPKGQGYTMLDFKTTIPNDEQN